MHVCAAKKYQRVKGDPAAECLLVSFCNRQNSAFTTRGRTAIQYLESRARACVSALKSLFIDVWLHVPHVWCVFFAAVTRAALFPFLRQADEKISSLARVPGEDLLNDSFSFGSWWRDHRERRTAAKVRTGNSDTQPGV